MTNEIIQISDYREITTSITDDPCLVFTDLDETVIVPNISFIEGVTVCDDKIELLKMMYSAKKWEQIHQEIKRYYYDAESVLVQDDDTKNVIDEIREAGGRVKVFGLTSRSYRDVHTAKFMDDLEQLGIRFNDFQLDLTTVESSRGIIFTNHRRKGPILAEFLEKTYIPYLKTSHVVNDRVKVIFIDNTLAKCVNMLECFNKLKLNGVRLDFQIYHYVRIEEVITTEDMFEDLIMITNKIFK